MLAQCSGKVETNFTREVKDICEEYDDKGIEKEDFIPEIDDGKSRSCIDERLKDSVEKVQFTKNDKIQEATDESKEMLKKQKDASIQMHYETFVKKHDIKRELHSQENWKKTHRATKNKKNPAPSLISSDKKDKDINVTLNISIQ